QAHGGRLGSRVGLFDQSQSLLHAGLVHIAQYQLHAPRSAAQRQFATQPTAAAGDHSYLVPEFLHVRVLLSRVMEATRRACRARRCAASAMSALDRAAPLAVILRCLRLAPVPEPRGGSPRPTGCRGRADASPPPVRQLDWSAGSAASSPSPLHCCRRSAPGPPPPDPGWRPPPATRPGRNAARGLSSRCGRWRRGWRRRFHSAWSWGFLWLHGPAWYRHRVGTPSQGCRVGARARNAQGIAQAYRELQAGDWPSAHGSATVAGTTPIPSQADATKMTHRKVLLHVDAVN